MPTFVLKFTNSTICITLMKILSASISNISPTGLPLTKVVRASAIDTICFNLFHKWYKDTRGKLVSVEGTIYLDGE